VSAALKILAELNALSKQRYVSSYEKALIYVGLGKNGQTLNELGEAYKEGSYWMFNLKYEPRLDPLRSDAAFQDLVSRGGECPGQQSMKHEFGDIPVACCSSDAELLEREATLSSL
jgi:hypothetical protein